MAAAAANNDRIPLPAVGDLQRRLAPQPPYGVYVEGIDPRRRRQTLV
jgi:hypothetical protein